VGYIFIKEIHILFIRKKERKKKRKSCHKSIIINCNFHKKSAIATYYENLT